MTRRTSLRPPATVGTDARGRLSWVVLEPQPSRRYLLTVTAIAIALFAITAAIVAWLYWNGAYGPHGEGLDVGEYRRYAGLMLAGRLPYRDFRVEYPPFFLPFALVPTILTGGSTAQQAYDVALAQVVVLAGLGLIATTAWILRALGASRRRLLLVMAALGLAPLAIGPMLIVRYDIWPALLAAVGVALYLGRRNGPSAVALGLATLAKVYPALLVALLLIDLARRATVRAAVVYALTIGATLAVVAVPFLLVAPRGLASALAAQVSRPLEIGSLGGSALVGLHVVFDTPLTIVASYGSRNVAGEAAYLLAVASSVATILASLAILAWIWRRPPTMERLVRAFAGITVAYVAFGKVLSPQYLIWLLPLVVLIPGRRGAAAGAMLVAAFGLTQVLFPAVQFAALVRVDPGLVAMLVARNAVLLALLAVILLPRRAPGGHGSMRIRPQRKKELSTDG